MNVGKLELKSNKKPVSGEFVSINDERFYIIRNYDRMQPFFISLANDSDLWMYLSSTGGLTAGRRSPDNALFPYYTDDKITEQHEQTGPKTIIRVTEDGETCLWEPFSDRYAGIYRIERSIAKSTTGNKIIFFETNHDLGLRFSYLWCAADRFGWIRRASVENLGERQVGIEILDGLQNILPAGTNRVTQNVYSTLVDAYKRTELVESSSLVLFRMEAIMVDKAEPSESLKCNTVLTVGLHDADYLTSTRQLDSFCRGESVYAEPEAKGVRGACFAHAAFSLDADAHKVWYQVADLEQDAVQVCDILAFAQQSDAAEQLEKAMQDATDALFDIVRQNDGVQFTGDEYNDARHFANTLFNTMRGGYYLDDYNINMDAFAKHVKHFNRSVYQRHKDFLTQHRANIKISDSFSVIRKDVFTRDELLAMVGQQHDPQLTRLFMEYLPITFGRRHGDPSRPWNLFNIRVKDDNGNPVVSYQGNWRDIFQNWEALSLSYPLFVNNIIAKFLNATTVDGYNPYKITSEGIDWEVINPDDPWSNIGYWGDHQIIYLLKLVELSCKYNPQSFSTFFNSRQFAFANVPYRLKPYSNIVADPKNSIIFDNGLHNSILSLVPTYGEDARLVRNDKGEVVLTTMPDKMLITLLAKLSNLIPDAGIWMNTLRPEWNDANNALVGYGASMVTLYYMYRYVNRFIDILKAQDSQFVTLSEHVARWVDDMDDILRAFKADMKAGFSPQSRRAFVDRTGKAAENYRTEVYQGFNGQFVDMPADKLLSFLNLAQYYLSASIEHNRRADGLYHAYNLVDFKDGTVSVTPLYEMLEGQVAVLSSGYLSTQGVVDLLDALRNSALYREDQRSYMLYPNRRLPSFLNKNVLPDDAVHSAVVKKLLENKSVILRQDRNGNVHFNADYHNAAYLAAGLQKENLLTEPEQQQMLDLYEQVFNHKAFTGRSGTFYKYEGLGSIYWHMVSKLLLAVGENMHTALNACEDTALLDSLSRQYDAIREGIGSHKSPAEYGSFPFDAYSHTPVMSGVQQPGMTGQVKEDIISRFNELGIDIAWSADGPKLKFNSWYLDKKDFIDNQLQFTYCNTLIDYRLTDRHGEIIVVTDDDQQTFKGYTMPADLTQSLLAHEYKIKQIVVFI